MRGSLSKLYSVPLIHKSTLNTNTTKLITKLEYTLKSSSMTPPLFFQDFEYCKTFNFPINFKTSFPLYSVGQHNHRAVPDSRRRETNPPLNGGVP